MENIKIKLVVIIIVTVIGVINCCNAYAITKDPNSSKGFAEYDDTTAAEENEKLIEEQEEEKETNEIKSTNNYLENLQIEGYQISPEFEKQTLEYTLIEQIESEEINIIATASDEKATIEGTGNIKLKTGKNQYRIDVTAESGTVRTYIINIEKIEKVEKVEKSENTIENTIQEVVQYEKTTETNYTLIYLILVIVIIVCIIVFKIKITKNKNRRSKK